MACRAWWPNAAAPAPARPAMCTSIRPGWRDWIRARTWKKACWRLPGSRAATAASAAKSISLRTWMGLEVTVPAAALAATRHACAALRLLEDQQQILGVHLQAGRAPESP